MKSEALYSDSVNCCRHSVLLLVSYVRHSWGVNVVLSRHSEAEDSATLPGADAFQGAVDNCHYDAKRYQTSSDAC